MSSISVVIPCCNEEQNINPLFDRLRRVLSDQNDYEIIFIDDGSSDRTLEYVKALAAKSREVRYISFTRNFGLEAAFRAGFKYATKRWIVQIDGDLQCPPEEIHKLINKIEEGYDIVYGLRQQRQDSMLKILGSKLQHFVAIDILGIKMPRGASTFRIIDNRVAKKIISQKTANPYFLAQSSAMGARYAFVEVAHSARVAGTSKIGLIPSIRSTIDLFVGHSNTPLIFFFMAALCALLSALMIGLKTAATVVTVLVLLGLWVQGRYLARLVDETVANPLYLVREANLIIDPKDDFYQFEQCPDRGSRKA